MMGGLETKPVELKRTLGAPHTGLDTKYKRMTDVWQSSNDIDEV